jgi:hypothetical protein
MKPALDAFTPRERALVARLTTPLKVQRWLNALPYNSERHGDTLRTFRGVVRTGHAHCLEAALSAAAILEQHGYPPLVMSIESVDLLDHVIFVYRRGGRWGSVARSRDPGLHGRRPLFGSCRALALSYVDSYVDYTGRVRGYGVANLDRALGRYDWRLSVRNVWKVEQLLIDWPHRRIRTSTRRHRWLKDRYVAYRARYGHKPVYYANRHAWTPIPDEFQAPLSRVTGAASDGGKPRTRLRSP